MTTENKGSQKSRIIERIKRIRSSKLNAQMAAGTDMYRESELLLRLIDESDHTLQLTALRVALDPNLGESLTERRQTLADQLGVTVRTVIRYEDEAIEQVAEQLASSDQPAPVMQWESVDSDTLPQIHEVTDITDDVIKALAEANANKDRLTPLQKRRLRIELALTLRKLGGVPKRVSVDQTPLPSSRRSPELDTESLSLLLASVPGA